MLDRREPATYSIPFWLQSAVYLYRLSFTSYINEIAMYVIIRPQLIHDRPTSSSIAWGCTKQHTILPMLQNLKIQLLCEGSSVKTTNCLWALSVGVCDIHRGTIVTSEKCTHSPSSSSCIVFKRIQCPRAWPSTNWQEIWKNKLEFSYEYLIVSLLCSRVSFLKVEINSSKNSNGSKKPGALNDFFLFFDSGNSTKAHG